MVNCGQAGLRKLAYGQAGQTLYIQMLRRVDRVWDAVALCITSQGSWCSTTVALAAFMAIDKLHWLPIHSLMLMLDQLHCRPMFLVLQKHFV